MKKILVTALIIAFVVSAISMVCAEEKTTFNMVGHWTGKVTMHHKIDGFKCGQEPLKFIVEKQEGNHFTGKKIWVSNDKEMTEPFSGVVALSNDRFYVAEHEDGMIIGDIVSKDKIVIYYIEDGENAKIIMAELTRNK